MYLLITIILSTAFVFGCIKQNKALKKSRNFISKDKQQS